MREIPRTQEPRGLWKLNLASLRCCVNFQRADHANLLMAGNIAIDGVVAGLQIAHCELAVSPGDTGSLLAITWPRESAITLSMSADEVEGGKPEPDPYVGLAVRLQLAPEFYDAVEDSAEGIRSANESSAPGYGTQGSVIANSGTARLQLMPPSNDLSMMWVPCSGSAPRSSGAPNEQYDGYGVSNRSKQRACPSD
jgi:hypothetical protein